MESDMPKTIEVPESVGPLMLHLSTALRRLLVDSKRSSAITSPELMKRFELLLQCGF
jgi:hypothetical protein